MLLLFFVGMEVSPPKLAANWRVAIFGTLLQISLTTGLVFGLGHLLGWSLPLSILIGFVVSLSSTAVVLKLLQDWKELDTTVGQDVLAVLLAQDLAVILMIICIGFLGGETLDSTTLKVQVTGAVIFIGIILWATLGQNIKLPFGDWIRRDRELQILVALLICFGLSLLSGVFDLSTALGAFVAGIVIHAARETMWVEHSLHGFRVIFIAFFFVSVGMLINVPFLKENWLQVVSLVFVAVIANTFINAVILRLLRRSWSESLYAGALLSQIGEFSFVLAAVGSQSGLIDYYAYQLTISVIAISLILSPVWIAGVKWFNRRAASRGEQNSTETS
jgi:CPA2 family monovalent cation:H+ antiporter-2